MAGIFSFWLASKRRAQELALRAEANARKLSDLSSERPAGAPKDIISVLESTCLLLERSAARHELSQQVAHVRREIARQDAPGGAPSEIETRAAETLPEPPRAPSPPPRPETEPELFLPARPPVEPALDQSKVAPQVPRPEPELSPTAKELIKVRDWVLLAQSSGTAVAPGVREEVHRQLARVLAKEGVIPLEETGTFDYNRQSVSGTHPTDDPEQDDMVCSTVRPGYQFHGQLVRPQEVIIYVYGDSASSSAP